MVHVVTSSQGGLLSLSVDGFETGDTIDTYSGGENDLPECYPVQFPPFITPPPNYGSKSQYNVTLKLVGSSPNAPNGTASFGAQFDSFAIPVFLSSEKSSTSSRSQRSVNIEVILVPISFLLYFLTCHGSW